MLKHSTVFTMPAIFIALALPVSAGDFPPIEFPDDGNGITFTTPSHNIECIYIPSGGTKVYKPPHNEAELSCDRAEPTYLRFQLELRGAANEIKNPGDQSCCSDVNSIPYGRSWHRPPFTCESTATGLTCERDDKHGFFISRTNTKVY